MEASAPPRVVFVPVSSAFGPPSLAGASNYVGFPSAELTAQRLSKAIHTETLNFRVHVWGAAATADRDGDYDAAQVLYQALIRSVQRIANGCYRLTNGEWTDATLLTAAGREFVFGLSIDTPISQLPLVVVDPATVAVPTLVYAPADGSASESP